MNVFEFWFPLIFGVVGLIQVVRIIERPRRKRRAAKHAAGRDEPGLRDITAELQAAKCPVKSGNVPKWIDGTFYRQSGGAFLPPESTIGFAYVHGLAHIAALRLQDGQVTMSNRCIKTQKWKEFMDSGKSKREWANPHEMSESCRAVEGLYEGPNPNVTVWKLGDGKVAALSESRRGRIIAIDSESLETLETIDTIKDDAAFLHAAHFYAETTREESEAGFHCAITCHESQRETGTHYEFGYAIYFGGAADSPLECVAELKVTNFSAAEADSQKPESRVSYIHTLGVTSNYVVLFASDRRLSYTNWLAQREDSSKTFGFYELWGPTGVPASLHIFKRSEDNKLEYLGERRLQRPHMVWHTGNSFEDSNQALVVDVTSMIGRQRRLCRFTVPMTPNKRGDTVVEEDLSMDAHEFPCINPHLHGLEHKFTYALSDPYKTSSRIYKYDHASGKHLSWGDNDLTPSEPVFIPRIAADGIATGSIDEDDGAVLAIVNDPSDDSSFLVILDARTFDEIARVRTPVTVNHGIHSVYMPAPRTELQPKIRRY